MRVRFCLHFSFVLGEVLNLEMASALSSKAGEFICSFGKRTRIQRKVIQGQIKDDLVCLICKGQSPMEAVSAAMNSLIKEIMIKLIGHEEKRVQNVIVASLLKPMSNHIGIDCGLVFYNIKFL
jgi:hypothetical protein